MNYNHYSKNQNYDLEQGKIYNQLNKLYYKIVGKKHINLIQQSTSSNLGSFYEAMTNTSIDNRDGQMTQRMIDLQNKFNSTLNEYTESYKQYLQQFDKNSENNPMRYADMNVRSKGGKFYYVNKYGYTRGYSSPSWNNRDSSCPSSPPKRGTENIFYRLRRGAEKGSGEPCGLEGTNIRNASTGAVAWVDAKGFKHHYPNQTIWNETQKNGNCSSSYKNVSNEIYNSVPSGSDMNPTSKCETGKFNEPLWNRILQLNDRLIQLAEELYDESNKIRNKEDDVSNELSSTQNELMNYISELEKERKQLEKIQQKNLTLQGRYDELKVDIRSQYMRYVAWTVGALTLGTLAFHHITKS